MSTYRKVGLQSS